MTGSGDKRLSATPTEWRTESRYYRRAPGRGWLLGLLLIPLLFGWLGWGAVKQKADVGAPSIGVTAPSAVTPSLNFSPLSILRNGNDFTLSGILPDLSVKDSLLATLRATLGPTVNLIDKIDTAAGATAPGFDGLAGLLDAATDIPNFQFTAEGGAVTLTGTAPSEQVKAAVEAAARRGWPNVQIINNIAIAGAAPSCENLQATIDANLAAPMKFQSGSATVTPDGRQQMLPVISAVRDCPGTELTVIGHTDNTGDDAINDPLSENRAAAVAAYLVSQGVPADSVTSQGAGSAEPIADNDTEAGRAQNRRTEIMVN